MADTPQTNGGVPLSGTEMLTLFGSGQMLQAAQVPNLALNLPDSPINQRLQQMVSRVEEAEGQLTQMENDMGLATNQLTTLSARIRQIMQHLGLVDPDPWTSLNSSYYQGKWVFTGGTIAGDPPVEAARIIYPQRGGCTFTLPQNPPSWHWIQAGFYPAQGSDDENSAQLALRVWIHDGLWYARVYSGTTDIGVVLPQPSANSTVSFGLTYVGAELKAVVVINGNTITLDISENYLNFDPQETKLMVSQIRPVPIFDIDFVGLPQPEVVDSLANCTYEDPYIVPQNGTINAFGSFFKGCVMFVPLVSTVGEVNGSIRVPELQSSSIVYVAVVDGDFVPNAPPSCRLVISGTGTHKNVVMYTNDAGPAKSTSLPNGTVIPLNYGKTSFGSTIEGVQYGAEIAGLENPYLMIIQLVTSNDFDPVTIEFSKNSQLPPPVVQGYSLPSNVELINASYDNGLLTYNQSDIDFNNDGNPDAYATGFFAPDPAVGGKVFHLKVPSFTEGALNIYFTTNSDLPTVTGGAPTGPAAIMSVVEGGIGLHSVDSGYINGIDPLLQTGDELLVTVSPDNKTLSITTPQTVLSVEYPTPVDPAYLMIIFATNAGAEYVPNLEVHYTVDPQT